MHTIQVLSETNDKLKELNLTLGDKMLTLENWAQQQI